jgi:hypothetical protein
MSHDQAGGPDRPAPTRHTAETVAGLEPAAWGPTTVDIPPREKRRGRLDDVSEHHIYIFLILNHFDHVKTPWRYIPMIRRSGMSSFLQVIRS